MEPTTKFLAPDYECRGCAFEGFGETPLRCPKCGSVTFKRRRQGELVSYEDTSAAILRMRHDAIAVRRAVVRMQLRVRGKKIAGRMYAAEAAANEALRMLAEVKNPLAIAGEVEIGRPG